MKGNYYLFLFVCLFHLTVNGLTDGSSWKAVATTVCVYVLLKFLQGGGAGWSFSLSSLSVSRASSIHSQTTLHSALSRCLRLCQQPALLPVDPRAAVHQPGSPGASFRPPALAITALAPGAQDWRRVAEHRSRDLFHQQPAQVR